MIERRPRAPVPRSRAPRAMARMAEGVMCRPVLLISSIFSYCRDSAFRGLVSTSISSSSVRAFTIHAKRFDTPSSMRWHMGRQLQYNDLQRTSTTSDYS